MIVWKGRLCGSKPVQIGRIQREQLPPVLQAEAQTVGHIARAKGGEIALDQRDHVAFAVGRRKVDRVGPALEPARRDLLGRPLGVDQLGPFAGVIF